MMHPPKGLDGTMRTITAFTTALVLGFPAVSAAAASDMPLHSSAANSTAERLAQSDAPARSTISLEARQLQGAEAIYVEGSAPPNLSVTITLLATVSSDIPTIVVSRHDVVTDVNGRFGAVIPIASAYERGTLLEVLATSAAGTGSASARLVTGAPNEGVVVPLEQRPH